MKGSIWNGILRRFDFPDLDHNTFADAAIIGGGITGITTAQLLTEAGLRVVVLEARDIGGGTTAHSTGNLYATVDKSLKKLKQKHGIDVVRAVLKARKGAMQRIEANILQHEIDCDFKKVPWYLYSETEKHLEDIQSEFETTTEAGFEIEYTQLETPYQALKAVRLKDQAQFNSKLYTQALAAKMASPKCRIFSNTSAHKIEEDGDGFVITTHKDHKVKCKFLVHATHTPKGFKTVQALVAPYREYGIAYKIEQDHPDGIFWGYHDDENFISSRSYKHGGDTYIIVVGQPHKVGQQPDNEECVDRLHSFARQRFQVSEPAFEWGGQHYRPADFLPYIGKEKNSNEYIATGFSTDGLVYGTLSAEIMRDRILEKKSEISEIFDLNRHDYLKAAPEAIKENLNVGLQYLKDLPQPESESMEVANGEGKIIIKDGQKVAAFRKENGDLLEHSAVCPHMKCIVHWNSLEKSWDCPCHGSRFDLEGKVLEGPSLHNLHSVETKDMT